MYLSLGQLYLFRVKQLKDPLAFSKAKEILTQNDLFSTPDNQALALLLLAETSTSYFERSAIYRQLTQEAYRIPLGMA